MKTIILNIATIIFIQGVFAQNQWSAHIGINYSTFYDDTQSNWLPGLNIGFEKDWGILEDLSLQLQLMYSIKGGILTEKLIGPYGDFIQDIYLNDIIVRVGYLDIPLSFNYQFYTERNWNVSLLLGYFINIPIADYSKIEKTKFMFTYDPDNEDHQKIKFEYLPFDQSGFGIFNEKYKLNQGIRLGLRLILQDYIFTLIYNKDLTHVGYVDTISIIDKHIHTITFIFGIYL
jgi:hypothetical protein